MATKTSKKPDTDYRQQAANYFQAALSQCGGNWVRPLWVPSRIRLSKDLTGDFPIGHTTKASAGDHDCKSNQWGAVSVLAKNGLWLGVKPCECEVLEFTKNKSKSETSQVEA